MDGISDIELNSVKNETNEEILFKKSSLGMSISPTSPGIPFKYQKIEKEPIVKKAHPTQSEKCVLPANQKFFKPQMSPKEKLRLEPLTATFESSPQDATPLVAKRLNINHEKALKQDYKPMFSKLAANAGTTGGQ